MAEAGPNVGFATLSIIPSLKGVEAAVAGGLDAPLTSAAGKAGDKAGESASKSFASKFVAGAKIAAAGVASAAAIGIGAFAGLAAIGASFDEAFDTIRIGTGKAGQALEGLKGDFKSVVSDIPTSFAAAGDAITSVNQRLGLTGAPLQAVSKQLLELSRLTGTDLTGNLEAVTGLFNNFGIAAGDQSGKLDELFRASQASGIGVSELATTMSSAGVVLRQVGLSFEQSAALLAGLAKSGIDAGSVIPALSKSLATAAKAGKSASDVFKDTFAAIKNAPSDTAAAAAAIDVFGARAGPKLAGAIREGKLALDDLTASIGGGSDTILKAAADTNDFGEKFQILKNRVFVGLEPLATAAFDAIGKGLDALGPIFTEVSAGLTAFFAAFKDGGDDVTSSGLAGAFEKFGLAARNVFDFIAANFPAIKGAIVSAFETAIPIVLAVADALGKALGPVIKSLAQNLPPILKLLGDAFKVVGTVLRATLLPALKVLAPIIGTVAAGFIDLLGFLARNRAVLIAIVAPFAAIAVAMAAMAIAGVVATAVESLGAAIFLLNLALLANPVVLIAVGVAALGAAIVLAYQKIKPFRDAVDATGRALKIAFVDSVKFITANWKILGAILLAPFLPLIAIVTLIIRNWSTLVGFFSGVVNAIVGFFTEGFGTRLVSFIVATFNNIVQIFTGVFNVILGLVHFFIAVFTGDWSGAWQAIVQVVSGVWAIITGIIGQALNVLQTVFTAGFAAIKTTVLVGVKAIGDFFGTLPGRIAGIALSVAIAAFNLGKGIITGLVNGVTGAVGVIGDIGKAVSNAIAHFINDRIIKPFNDALEFTISLPFGAHFTVDPPDIPRLPTFASGGIVPGPLGAPVLAIVHGGENVQTKKQQSASGGSTTVNLFGSTVTAEDITREVRWLQLTGS